jgi:hypothetical protein
MASSTFFAPDPIPTSPCAVKWTVPLGPGWDGLGGELDVDGDGCDESDGDGGGGSGGGSGWQAVTSSPTASKPAARLNFLRRRSDPAMMPHKS